jgi:hypothetical protein
LIPGGAGVVASRHPSGGRDDLDCGAITVLDAMAVPFDVHDGLRAAALGARHVIEAALLGRHLPDDLRGHAQAALDSLFDALDES